MNLQQHEYAWWTGIPRLTPLLFRLHARGGGNRPPLEPSLLHYNCRAGRRLAAAAAVAMLHPRRGISAHCGLFVFARSCHIQPVSTGPWEIYTEAAGMR